jgi:hypothetical protein
VLGAAPRRAGGTAGRLAVALAVMLGAQAAAAQAVGSPFAVLKGRWVRPDGGYVIDIRAVAADGQLDAAYANPRPLPFARAVAMLDGKTLKLFLELRAGGYNGSTYTLQYDPADDTLRGEYFQAVAQQKFAVRFHRLAAQ